MKLHAPLLTLLFSACAAFAQTPTASVVGRITDGTGAVVPGATVTVTNPDTNLSRSVVSNKTGDFVVPYLDPARYRLEAQAPGFRTYQRDEFTLAVDQSLRLDIRLELGAVTEVMTVTETPPVLNTESATRGEVTTKAEIAQLPLEGRSFSDLALLTGGVIPKGDGGDGSFAANGARADNGAFLLDGVNNTQRRNTNVVINPPIEGIQEFKMLTSGYSAEYGRYAGGVLSVVTKSGTNRLQGSVYEFVRNDAFDARGYFDPGKSKLRRNQFGATVSGPVNLPKLYDGRNRTFFMVTWESLRQTDGQAQRALVPTPEMLRGDFSNATTAAGKPLTLIDPLTKNPFPNNQLPADRMDPVALRLARYYPAPTISDGPYNYVSQGNATNHFDSFGIKLDHTLRGKDRLSASTFWRTRDTWNPVDSKGSLALFGTTNHMLELLSYVKYLRTLSSSMLLETSANFSRRTNHEVWPYSPDQDWAAETGFVGGTTSPIAAGPPYLQITGYVPLGPINSMPKIWSFDNYQYSAAITWYRGRHSLKVGGDVLRMHYDSETWGDTRGRASFLGRFTGHPVADFLLGWADSTRRQLDASGPHHRIDNFSGFVQDDVKLGSSLTVNLGLRYDLMKPPTEKSGALAEFLPPLGKIVVSGTGGMSQEDFDARINAVGLGPNVVKAKDVGLPATIVKTDWNNFAPRVGFAWRILGSPRSVLRGGYGIFYGSSSLYRMDEYSDTYPFSVTETFSRVSSDPRRLTLSNPFPADRRGFSGVTSSYGQESVSPKTQYLQAWSLALEREFWRGTVLEIAYAGSKGTHLQRRYDINQPGRDQANSTVRPFPAFGSIQIINDGANSSYHSGQVTVRRRFSNQLYVRASYTFAKSIDESSNTGGTIAYNFSQAQDSRHLKLERGRSDFDIRHAFTGSLIFTPRFSNHWLARDWQLAGTWNVYSGPPFTPRVANVNYSAGEATRPDRIGEGTVANPTANRWYDVSAFQVVPTGSYRFGDSGRNILSGPGTMIINASLSRRIGLGKSRSLQYRLEAFNLPNHPNLGLPENNVDVPTAGSIRAAKNSRNLQMGLRLEF